MNNKIFKIRRTINKQPLSVINNPAGYQWLVYLSLTYFCFMIFNAIMTNRYIGNDYLFVLGGTFTSPFVFLIDNIIAEIYGYTITRNMILAAILAQTLFIILCQIVLFTPYSSTFENKDIYSHILGSTLFRIHLSGCASYLLAMLLNCKILTIWKVFLKGRKFWLRSLGACTIAELLYSFIAILLMEFHSVPLLTILKIVLVSYMIKIIYNVILVGPAQLLVNIIRAKTGIDVFDFHDKFVPSFYKRLTE